MTPDARNFSFTGVDSSANSDIALAGRTRRLRSEPFAGGNRLRVKGLPRKKNRPYRGGNNCAFPPACEFIQARNARACQEYKAFGVNRPASVRIKTDSAVS